LMPLRTISRNPESERPFEISERDGFCGGRLAGFAAHERDYAEGAAGGCKPSWIFKRGASVISLPRLETGGGLEHIGQLENIAGGESALGGAEKIPIADRGGRSKLRPLQF